MGSICDIRRIHDPKEYPNVISHLLTTHPPSGVPLLDSAGHPLPEGLDCLTHLIRHLRAQWQDYFENAEDEEEEAINPILRYAWLKFYPDSEDPGEDVELVEEARKAKGDVSRALQLVVHVDLEHMGQFLELCCSPLMNQTLWSRREWCLLHSILYRNANEPIWREKACPGREENGRRSLLHYDCRIEKSLSLQEFIRTQFEPRINADGSSELWLSRAPKVVRVLYNPSTTARKSFHDLRDFEMPIFDYTRAAEWLNDVGTFDDMPRETADYTLLAVVRCDDTQTGVDVIRTYEPYMAPMPTSYLRSFLGIQPDWSLQDDTPAQYLLAYGKFAQRRIYDAVCDEFWPLLPDDEEVKQIMDWAMDELAEELSKPQPHDAEHVGDGGEGSHDRYNDRQHPGGRGAGRETPNQEQSRLGSRGRGLLSTEQAQAAAKELKACQAARDAAAARVESLQATVKTLLASLKSSAECVQELGAASLLGRTVDSVASHSGEALQEMVHTSDTERREEPSSSSSAPRKRQRVQQDVDDDNDDDILSLAFSKIAALTRSMPLIPTHPSHVVTGIDNVVANMVEHILRHDKTMDGLAAFCQKGPLDKWFCMTEVASYGDACKYIANPKKANACGIHRDRGGCLLVQVVLVDQRRMMKYFIVE